MKTVKEILKTEPIAGNNLKGIYLDGDSIVVIDKVIPHRPETFKVVVFDLYSDEIVRFIIELMKDLQRRQPGNVDTLRKLEKIQRMVDKIVEDALTNAAEMSNTLRRLL